MAFTHGSQAKFKLGDAAGVLQDLSAYITSISMPREIEEGETTTLAAGATGARTFIPGLIGATISLEGKFDPALDTHMNGILRLIRDFEYYPAGEPAGATKPKYSGECFVTSYETDTDVDNPSEWSAELRITGVVARATS